MKTRLVGRCVLVASLTALAGCGTTTQDRSLSVVEGAVLGALGGGLSRQRSMR